MPVTRSMKSAPRQDGPPLREEESTSRPDAATTGTASGSEPTASSATTTESGTATTAPDTSATSIDATSALKSTVPEKPVRTPARSRASSRRRRGLAEARLELLRARVELAEAKVSALEEETSEEEDSIEETVREERTSEWVDRSTLALTMEPHKVQDHSSDPPPAVLPPPPTCDDEPGRRVDAEARGAVNSIPTNPEPRPYWEGAVPGEHRHTVALLEPPPRQEEPGLVIDRRAALAQEPWNHATGEPRQPVAPRQPPTLQEIRKQIENRRWDTAQGPPSGDVAEGPRQLVAPRTPPTRQEDSKPNELAIQQLASAITLAARSAAQPAIASRVPDLPFFSGQSAEWLPFKIAVEESMAQLTEQENIARLRRSLRGPARDAAHCLFVGHTSTREVMQLLQARFGRPDALVMAEMKKLRELPRLTESPKDVCVFASRVANITATIKALGRSHYLYNPEIVRTVVDKFPPTLRFRYYDFAPEQPAYQPDLVTLTKFLDIAAERCGNFAPLEHVPQFDRREQHNRGPARTYHAEGQRPKPEPCPVCRKGEHKVNSCEIFKKENVSARWDIAREKRLCFKCLRVRRGQHSCKTRRCETSGCQYYHHPLLHSTPNTPPKPPPEQEETVSSARNKTKTALLKIVPVIVSGPRSQVETYALLDDGSTCTIIEKAVADKVGAKGTASPFCIEGVAGARIDASESTRVRVKIGGKYSLEEFEVAARTMEKLHLSPQRVPPELISGLDHLKEIAEELVYEEGKPTVLIGQDNWQLLLAHAVRRGAVDQPVASLTDLGWVLHGVRDGRREKSHSHRISYVSAPQPESSIEEMIREHFSLDSLCVEPRRSYNDSEKRALSILNDTTKRLPAGGFETGLLWRRDDFTPPDSYSTALRRLELIEKKLDRDPALKKRYAAQIEDYMEKDYAEEAPVSVKRPEKVWYLPHFGVVNPEKPEKLRIVHDAAAKSRGISLNDLLLSGPDLLQSLPGVLMRFRQRNIAVTADIRDMFMRISIREEDRDMQRFLWRGERRDGPPTEYRMKSVIFGATSSPSTAIYVKNRNAEYFKEKYPEAADAVVRSHYVDDYLASYDSEEDALRVSNQVAFIHSRGNFFLAKWASNSQRVRGQLAPGEKKEVVQLDTEKILGMVWRTQTDTLSFNINERKLPTSLLAGTPTKREALRVVMSIYDPLGLATPITVQAKRVLQNTWRSGIEWDTELQPAEAEAWRSWVGEAKQLSSLAVPRCYAQLAHATSVELHTFVDASSSAYAAVSYWRVTDSDGRVHISLIAAKGRVAPLKTVSIPRLELQAAVLGARLAQTIVAEHDIKPHRRVFWSDSRTVLAWLRNGPRAYKPFVSHRIAEIGESTKTTEWRWVPTKANVADDATRETPTNFESTHRWFIGPPFLHLEESEWPLEVEDNTPDDVAATEERLHVTRPTTRLIDALPDVKRFSNFNRLLRATARVLQFIELLRAPQQCNAAYKRTKKNTESDSTWRNNKENRKKIVKKTETGDVTTSSYKPLEVHHLHRAQLLWTRAQQEEVFADDVTALRLGRPLPTDSRLKQLSVTYDRDGVIRLRSRIDAATDICYSQREPAIIDGGHAWTQLYITHVHTQLHHGGFETTANEVRQHYWVLRLRYAVRSAVKRCQRCRIAKAKPAQPSTGNHPPSRLAHHQRAFTFAALDYFGPLTVTVGRTHQKRYGVLYTCLTTRAVHIELAGSLSTDSAVMALRRFIGRRGCPTELWSDQGTNLRGADIELRRAIDEATQEEASLRAIRWRFIPPSAPFMGGAWERMVRSIKTALYTTLNERAPKEEVLATLLVEAEHTVNSRPLTHLSTAPDDEEALTPNHFLLGGPSRVPLPGTFTDGDISGRREWRVSQRLADHFWARWVREYLPELQHRREPRATGGAIQLGDLVLIADGTLPRNIWPRGVVIATFPGPDGEVRAVDVRTNKGVLRRPTKKLVILPTANESS